MRSFRLVEMTMKMKMKKRRPRKSLNRHVKAARSHVTPQLISLRRKTALSFPSIPFDRHLPVEYFQWHL